MITPGPPKVCKIVAQNNQKQPRRLLLYILLGSRHVGQLDLPEEHRSDGHVAGCQLVHDLRPRFDLLHRRLSYTPKGSQYTYVTYLGL